MDLAASEAKNICKSHQIRPSAAVALLVVGFLDPKGTEAVTVHVFGPGRHPQAPGARSSEVQEAPQPSLL